MYDIIALCLALFLVAMSGLVLGVVWLVPRITGSPLRSTYFLEWGVPWTVDVKKISKRGDVVAIVSRDNGKERLLNLGKSDAGIPGVGERFIVTKDGGVKHIVL